MREVKFRAWDEDSKTMVYQSDNGDEYCWQIGAEEIWVENIREDYILKNKLMQYTGLKDKNGVEIFEGDILCGWIGSHWHSGEDKFEEVVKYDEKTASYNFPAIEVRHGDLRVIGNIFESGEILNDSENPELLETKKSS